MAYVHVAHDVIIGDGCIFSNNATLAGHVVVDSYAIVGGLTPIHQFCRIGSYSMTGGASATTDESLHTTVCPASTSLRALAASIPIFIVFLSSSLGTILV